jgi:hypothetical protein
MVFVDSIKMGCHDWIEENDFVMFGLLDPLCEVIDVGVFGLELGLIELKVHLFEGFLS